MPSTGCENDRKMGATTATAIFICMVYETSEAEFPPSLEVMTAAAVAVGHTKHIMADSRSTFALCGILSKKVIDSDSTMNGTN